MIDNDENVMDDNEQEPDLSQDNSGIDAGEMDRVVPRAGDVQRVLSRLCIVCNFRASRSSSVRRTQACATPYSSFLGRDA